MIVRFISETLSSSLTPGGKIEQRNYPFPRVIFSYQVKKSFGSSVYCYLIREERSVSRRGFTLQTLCMYEYMYV